MPQVFVWTLADVVVLSLFAILALWCVGVWSVFYVRDWWRQRNCKHDGPIGETQACDAICGKCGKNLGFIGNVRKARGA